MNNTIVEDNTKQALAAKDAAIRRALEAIGIRAVGLVSARTPVDTGRLRASNDYAVEGDTVEIGNVQDYAPYVELGTSKMRAQPYLRPGVENGIDDYKKIIEHEMKNA